MFQITSRPCRKYDMPNSQRAEFARFFSSFSFLPMPLNPSWYEYLPSEIEDIPKKHRIDNILKHIGKTLMFTIF